MNSDERTARRQRKKEPLYRKVNTTAHRVHRGRGGDFSDESACKGHPGG